jgi:NADPH:quinone reductase-like Zn-dependent oxidoreductase
VRYQGRVGAGQRVLINGAGGGVGTFAVQLAKAYGANVTGVDGTGKLDLLRSIGADEVVDYTREDFTREGRRYDLILDIPGNRSISECRRALAPRGTYALIGHEIYGGSGSRWIGRSLVRFLKLQLLSPFVTQRMAPRTKKESTDPLLVLKELIEGGKVTPVVDRTYALSEVPAAIRYLEDGQARGKVVISV